MSDLPKGWIECNISGIIDNLESGSRPKGGVKGIKEGIPSIGGEHLNNKGGFNFTNPRFIPIKFAASMKKGFIRNRDILIVKDGATTGKTSFVGDNYPYEQSFVNEHVFLVRIAKMIEPKFVFRYLFSDEGQKRILENFKGSAQGGINQSFINNLQIPLAPLNEQKRIVKKLDKLLAKVDSAKERLDKIPMMLKRFRQSVLSAAVSGELTMEWREEKIKTNCEQIIEKIKQDRLKLFSKEKDKQDFEKRYNATVDNSRNWVIVNSEFVCDFITKGTTPKKLLEKGDIPYLKVYNIINDIIDFDYKPQYISKETHYGVLRRSIVYPDDVLMNIVGPPLGKVAIVPKTHKEWNINQALAIFRPINVLLPNYLYIILKEASPIQEILLDTKGIVGQSNISLEQCRKLVFAIPPLEEQKEIVKRVEKLFQHADKIEERYNKAKEYTDKLTQSILAKAFRGELVPQDPNLPAPKPGKYWIYVLKCSNDSNYIGYTHDLPKRWEQHKTGEGADWTKKHPPQYIMYWEEYKSKTEALKREKQLKTGFGRKWIKREEAAGRLWRAGESASELLEKIKQEKAEAGKKKRN